MIFCTIGIDSYTHTYHPGVAGGVTAFGSGLKGRKLIFQPTAFGSGLKGRKLIFQPTAFGSGLKGLSPPEGLCCPFSVNSI